MSSVHMALVVTRKEVKNIFRNRGLLFAGLYIGVMFGALNVLLLGQVSAVNNTAYSVALLVGVFVGYSFSGSVFLREKRDRVIETLLCTPLSLKSIWSGKVLAVTIPAYLFSLLSVSLVLILSDFMAGRLLLPSIPILIHVLVVMPIFIASAVGLIGLSQFLLGMRENRIIGVLVILILLPFVYPSILGGLTQGNMNVEASWFEVEATLIASVILLALTTYLTRYLNKERVVTTIPSD